jgi:thiamine biosynthesis lipoprotein
LKNRLRVERSNLARRTLRRLKEGMRVWLLIALATFCAVSAVQFCGASAAPSAVGREVYLMGTRCSLTLYTRDAEQGVRRLESFIGILEHAERELSTWRPDSVLTRLNRHPVGPHFELGPLSPLFETLVRWSESTAGTFDPAIGSLVEAWGIRHSGRLPSDTVLAAARERSGMRHYSIVGNSVSKTRPVLMDCGAFGKGEALDRLLAAGGAEPWIVDLGGQMIVHGLPPGQAYWPIDIASPQNRTKTAAPLALTSGSLATSGGSERDLQVNGRRISHILDPRTGQPAQFTGSVSVWHEKALVADILSTALFVMGPEEGLAWAEDRGIAACFLVPDDRGAVRMRTTGAFAPLLRK